MIGIVAEMLSYPFLVRALIGGILVSLCASLLGVSLVLKRYSMIGDGLSHVSFGALSVAVAVGWSPLSVSIPVVVLAAFFLLRITESGKMKSDAAIAVISASALANFSIEVEPASVMEPLSSAEASSPAAASVSSAAASVCAAASVSAAASVAAAVVSSALELHPTAPIARTAAPNTAIDF